jgi:hypothetical protein
MLQTHGPKEDGIVHSTAIVSENLEIPEGGRCWSKHVVSIYQWCRKDFKVKTFKYFENRVACDEAKN